ncbi:Uma2 family endonuclease [Aquisphaera insulae]|uniref:Uma2 family endonuclease n=1 Tax=Aquisphaera insulae TaxID=2712864 RepID=UPI0013ED85DF|nr:Uma2 family endonuclease [Aquisphaera insulae]
MATAVALEALYTPDQFLDLPDQKGHELVRGRLREMNMGAESSWVSGELFLRLGQFNKHHAAGWLFPSEAGYQCFPHDPRMVRKPDISFIKRNRLPDDVVPTGWITIAPDLAVEVVSPKDRASELEEKLADYRIAGIPLIWVIYPESRSVMIYRGDGSVARLLEADSLSGENALPGFTCPIRGILPPARPAEKTRHDEASPEPPR